MKSIIGIVILILITSCSRPIHKKRKRCKGNGSWYGNRNLSQIPQSIQNPQNPQKTISYQHFIVSYPHLDVYKNNISK